MNSFSRSSRIRASDDYQVCYDRGKKYFSAHFIVFCLARSGEESRLGIAVSRKVGKAVFRNRIKRLLREFFRLNRHEMPGYDLVMVAKKNIGPMGLKDVEKELRPLLQQHGIMIKKQGL